MTDEDFYQSCQDNPDLRIERDASHNIIIMPPTGISTEWSNTDLIIELGIWNKKNQLGEVLGNNGGIKLPNGAVRVPDAAWISSKSWDSVSNEDKKGFLPICPEFIVEIRSHSDKLQILKEKMGEWIENGCLLGWLIDPLEKQVIIYYRDHLPQYLSGFDQTLSGEEILPGFEFDLKQWKIIT